MIGVGGASCSQRLRPLPQQLMVRRRLLTKCLATEEEACGPTLEKDNKTVETATA